MTLKRLTIRDQELVQRILDEAPQYLLNTDGVSHDPDGGRDTLTALPPGCTDDRKYVFLIEQDGRPVGVADLIQDFPNSGIAFLGLLLLRETNQGMGLGRAAYLEIESFAVNELRSKEIRLATVDSNPVTPFWEKMGFQSTGTVRPHEGKNLKSSKRLMRKGLTIEEKVFRAPFGTHLQTHGTQVVSEEGVYRVITPAVPASSRNEVIWANFSEEDAERKIDETIRAYAEHGLTFKWCMSPFSRPSDLAQRLARRGFKSWDCRAMWASLPRLEVTTPSGVAVEPVVLGQNDEEYLDAADRGWGEKSVAASAQGRENLRWALSQPHERYRYFLARYLGEAVGTAGYIMKPDGAYFVGGSVDAKVRGKGIYKALIHARQTELLNRGVELGFTHAREATSAPILEGLGWHTAYRYPIYLIDSTGATR